MLECKDGCKCPDPCKDCETVGFFCDKEGDQGDCTKCFPCKVKGEWLNNLNDFPCIKCPLNEKCSELLDHELPPCAPSSKLPTLESVQQAVVEAQLCVHGQVEVTDLVKFVYEHMSRQLHANG